MMGITGVWSRMIGELVQALKVAGKNSPCHDPNPNCNPQTSPQVDELMIRALTTVFGMENNGKIKKEKAKQVVEKLGLIYTQEEEEEEEENRCCSDEVAVEEVISGLEQLQGSNKQQLLREAFKIFDEDGNGFIEAIELKRVLQFLGLDKGWDMADIEKMLKVVDLNEDGKVDFSEFELLMMMT